MRCRLTTPDTLRPEARRCKATEPSASAARPSAPRASCPHRGAPPGRHWEIDSLLGAGPGAPWLVSAVERATGFVAPWNQARPTVGAFARRAIQLLKQQSQPVRTMTADNGPELTARERGRSEHANGLRHISRPLNQTEEASWLSNSGGVLQGLIVALHTGSHTPVCPGSLRNQKWPISRPNRVPNTGKMPPPVAVQRSDFLPNRASGSRNASR